MAEDGATAAFERDGSAVDPAERAVSEFTGVAILVAITLLVTGSVGLFVLVDPGSENKGPNANFSFQYIDQSSVLIVTHDRGDSFDAGNLSIRSQGTTVTWAALANTNDTAVVGPGATVQLSRRNAFGSPVSASGKARVLYKPPTGNETVLETWKGIG
ncbi:type IV pilin N-terminal domain-containing protein [Halosimplex aquaticum]|uniref:Type IV pilin N-terminal domain-containing protein n=1 Tax=Halosimplex aquaticum TaxID=3026162 RepID=A0ABD5XYX9_9EURY|nr:type IV pilin N-terminal domain-containing protein [Halosimplex aquaticum]